MNQPVRWVKGWTTSFGDPVRRPIESTPVCGVCLKPFADDRWPDLPMEHDCHCGLDKSPD